jgi:FkbM family methyltransferase
MIGYLTRDFLVEIDSRSVEMGGSWQGPMRSGKPSAWDTAVIEFFWKKARRLRSPVIFDVGANTGSFCLLAKFHQTMTVVAFEPNPAAREVLRANIELNGLGTRVRVLPYALTDEDGDGKLHIPLSESGEEVDSGGARLDPNDPTLPAGWKVVGVELRKLDSLNLGQPDLVKIDVEGNEYYTVMGMLGTLSTCPGIMIEWIKRNWGKSPKHYRRRETKRLLESLGYNSFERIGRADMWCDRT